jgi:Peptidase family M28
MMKSFNKVKIISLFIVFSFVSGFSQSDGLGLESITSNNLMQTVKTLCSDEFNGRLPGSVGYNKAAEFAAEKFEQTGLKPAGDENYFQYFDVEYNKIDSPIVFKAITPQEIYSYEIGKDFVFRGFTGSADLSLPVAFCGYGISRPDLGYDDYENIDIKNKVVLVFKQNPTWKINDSTLGGEYPREKSLVAYKHGAKGILFVSRPNDEKPQSLIGSVMHGKGEQIDGFPQLQISMDVAAVLLKGIGVSISECQRRIDECQTPNSFVNGNDVNVVVNTQYSQHAQTMNVIGLFEGNDPILKKEYLIIGAHLDHVGSQAGLLFPGANDNASGSAAVIEIAKAFQKSELKPKRSILFILFASEEQGLYGSNYFVEKLKADTSKIVAMFNLDCIGYGDSIQVGNGKSSPELWEIAKKTDDDNFNLLVENTWNGGGADLTPFYEKGIPGLYFVSKYSYDHLHQPSDTPETLNPKLYEKIVKLVYLTARNVADGNYNREVVLK